MLFGGIGGLRGGNLQPLMMGIRNYLLQKENPQIELPENIEKLVDFMKQTGGSVEDYVKLNKDYETSSLEIKFDWV